MRRAERSRFFTRQGDCGFSCVCGGRMSKAGAVAEACCMLDELNCFLGLARTEVKEERLDRVLEGLQQDLFVVGADLIMLSSMRVQRITKQDVARLERLVQEFSRGLPEPQGFVLPGGCRLAALLHVARAVCRRAEGRVIAAGRRGQKLQLVQFLNRLSSLLYVLALYANKKAGVREKQAHRTALPTQAHRTALPTSVA